MLTHKIQYIRVERKGWELAILTPRETCYAQGQTCQEHTPVGVTLQRVLVRDFTAYIWESFAVLTHTVCL